MRVSERSDEKGVRERFFYNDGVHRFFFVRHESNTSQPTTGPQPS